MPLPCHRLKLGETLTKSRPSTAQFDPLFSPIRPHIYPLCVKSRTTAVQAAHPTPRRRTAFARLLTNSFSRPPPLFLTHTATFPPPPPLGLPCLPAPSHL